MGATGKGELCSIDEYLLRERGSTVKHEYVNGQVFAMSGARADHNLLSVNAIASLKQALRGKPCRPFNSDMKVRISSSFGSRFYYPDLQVTCSPVAPDAVYLDEPVIILEVTSRSTRRLDLGEKREAYLTIPSLSVYLIADPGQPLVTAWRRGETGFTLEHHDTLEGIIPLPEIGVSLAMADLYDGVPLLPEAGDG